MPLQIVVYRKVINIILQAVLSGDLTRLPHEVAVIVDRTVVIEHVEVIRTVGTVVQKIAEDIVQICPLYQFVFVTESVVKRLTADAGALQNVLHGMLCSFFSLHSSKSVSDRILWIFIAMLHLI